MTLIVAGILLLFAVFALVIGLFREKSKTRQLIETISQDVSKPLASVVSDDSLKDLPQPVRNYFKHVLTYNQKLIKTVTMQQSGTLRVNTSTDNWLTFSATQHVAPIDRGFLWNARVNLPLATHIRVLDSYKAGVGSGRVSLLSTLAITSESDIPELNSGALYRFLAEAVWYPTALLPQSGVLWKPVNEYSALATIIDHDITVSLEFRFNTTGEVIGIYSPDRYGRFDGKYKQTPWEGHFRGYYEASSGIRVPSYGEVGWYVDEIWQPVWKGDIDDIQFEYYEGTEKE